MEIHGFQKLTLLDFPGRTACTVFLAGCNFRCPFCHNSLLVTEKPDACMTDADLAAYLKKRRFSTGLRSPEESRRFIRSLTGCAA